MGIVVGDGRSPWTKALDHELNRAVGDQVIDDRQAEELKRRLGETTARVDKAVRVTVILRRD